MDERGPANNNNNNNNGNNNNNWNGQALLWFILTSLIVLFIASSVSSRVSNVSSRNISYTQFKDMVRDDKVKSVVITSSRLEITPKDSDSSSSSSLGSTTYYTVRLDDENLLNFLDAYDVDVRGQNQSMMNGVVSALVSIVLPLVLVWILLAFLMRRMSGGTNSLMGVGKSNAKVYMEQTTGVTFADVAGEDEAKESLQEVVDFLHHPQRYQDIGAKLPKGALLVGPPGTGKTLLAKAVAGEARVPFFSLAGSDFVEMFVGVGASRVRDLFKEAQKAAPCIIFIDEIDAIGKSRDNQLNTNDEREQTLNQLLSEMDGFDSSKGVLILGATNRPEILDKALLRPGRFDRRIIVDKPDLKGRIAILKVHAKHVRIDESVDFDAIGLATAGCVGSDLANMINEAAIRAVQHGRRAVSQEDLFESVEVVIAGKEKKDRIMGTEEKTLVAYHEVGHALATALQKDTEPVQKITIVPRTMGSLGYTLQMPEEEKFLESRSELEARLVTYMAGRAAEEIACHTITTGAANDIEMATKIARAMVTQYGMSDQFGMMALESIQNQYLDGRAVQMCGDDTIARVDDVVREMLKKAYDTAKALLISHRKILDKIAQYLFEHETITGKEFMGIFNQMMDAGELTYDNAETADADGGTDSSVFPEPSAASEVMQDAQEPVEIPEGEPTAPDEAFDE